MSNYLLQVAYLIASVLFILGLKGLSSPKSARQGLVCAEIGMVVAIVGTLVGNHIITWQWILIGAVVGSAVGTAMAIFMPMTAMPQRIALSHSFGAMAAVLVGVAHYHHDLLGIAQGHAAEIGHGTMGALGFEILFGSLTITGSLMAFGKLQGIVYGPPITYRFQNFSNMGIFLATLGMFAYLIYAPQSAWVFYAMMLIGWSSAC